MYQEREFIKTNEPIFKLGRTGQENLTSMSKYSSGTRLMIQLICDDSIILENKLLQIFGEKYIWQRNIGNEYFSGDHKEMIKDIYTLIHGN